MSDYFITVSILIIEYGLWRCLLVFTNTILSVKCLETNKQGSLTNNNIQAEVDPKDSTNYNTVKVIPNCVQYLESLYLITFVVVQHISF